MQQMCTQADYRLLDAVHCVQTLTESEPAQPARERLRRILGYSLYRSLVVTLRP
jgi:hypothetical protein